MSRGGSKPGERRSGRCKGTTNKKTLAVAEVLAELGLDPIKQMGQITMDEHIDVSIRVQVLKELCQYVAPKRKAVEITGEDSRPMEVNVRWLDQNGA